MGEIEKKIILISEEMSKTSVGSFFQNLGFELSTVFNSETEYKFVIDDYLSNINHLPRLKVSLETKFPAHIEKQFKAQIDKRYLDSIFVQQLMHANFSSSLELDFVAKYGQNFKEAFTIKIQDYLNIGSFVDIVVSAAYKEKFPFEKIRSNLNELLLYGLKEIEQELLTQSLEVAFSFTEDVFITQVSFVKNKYDLESEVERCGGFFNKIITLSNFVDINFYRKRSKVTFTLLWFNDEGVQNFNSFFISEITAVTSLLDTNAKLRHGLENQEGINYQALVDNKSSKRLALAKKFAYFIEEFRKKENDNKPVTELAFFDIDDYLTRYPRQESLVELDDELRGVVLSILRETGFFANEDAIIINGAEEISEAETTRIKNVTDKHSDEVVRLKGQKLEDEEKVKIKGVTDSLKNNDLTKVAGDGNEEKDSNVIKIKGVTENYNDNSLNKIAGNGVTNENAGLIRIKNVTENINENKDSLNSTLNDAVIASKNVEIEKLEQQVSKMKMIMEKMKSEMIKMQTELEVYKENQEMSDPNKINDPSNEYRFKYEVNEKTKKKLEGEVSTLRAQIQKMTAAARKEVSESKKTDSNSFANENLEKTIVRIKEDNARLMKAKAEEIIDLQAKIKELMAPINIDENQKIKEKNLRLEDENRQLVSKLDLANGRILTAVENAQKAASDQIAKKEKEILELKTNMKLSQELIEKFKLEKQSLEVALLEEKENSKRIKSSIASSKPVEVSNSQIPEQAMSSQIALEKRQLEEKFKAQGIELKRIEQKLKLVTSQFEEAQKKKYAAADQSNKGSASNKQLEVVQAKIKEINEELLDKKKELQKFKGENTQLQAKVQDLEKKLGSAGKKAA